MIHKTITVEFILDVLHDNGYSPKLVDSYNDGSKTILFKVNDFFLYRIDPTQLPYVRIATACRIDPITDDIDLMYQAARQINESVFLGKVNVMDYGQIVSFQVEAMCDSCTYFRNNFKLFMDITDVICRRFLDAYKELKEEKKIFLQSFSNSLLEM